MRARRVTGLVLFLLAAVVSGSAEVHTNPLNRVPLALEGFQHFYDLDYPGAIQRFQQVRAEHPGDPEGTALLLDAEVFQELYKQDLLDTTFYANDGFLTGRHATRENPAARDRIFQLTDQAVREADARLQRNPSDVNALYSRGWARALKCAYIAMVERGFSGGFRLAGKAKDDEERVLQLDPDYIDAKLVPGVYQYVVGALPLPFKIIIGFVGISGSKKTGMAMLHDVAARGISNSVEARTVIALFLRREGKYRQAIEVVKTLEAQYPRDFLFALEEANLRKDAGEGMAAVDAYRKVIADAEKPGYFASAQVELAFFGLGDALRGQRHYGEAAQSYEQAAFTQNVGPELKVRSLLAAGQCRDLNHERALAKRDYQMTIDAGPSTSRADIARKYLGTPFDGS